MKGCHWCPLYKHLLKKVEPCTLKLFNVTLAVVTAGYVVSRIVSVYVICWFHFVCGVTGRKKICKYEKKFNTMFSTINHKYSNEQIILCLL